MAITRRDFMKISAATGAGVLFGVFDLKPIVAYAQANPPVWTTEALSVGCYCSGGCVVIVGASSADAQVRELTHQYLGIDAPTDVLSFPAGEADPDTGVTYLGDVIISVPQAGAQARAAGHALEAEVQLLVVHGVLHLLGHDHAQTGDSRMWAAQTEVLNQLGLRDMVIRE